MGKNLIKYNGNTLIDLTTLTVAQSDVKSGVSFVDKSGDVKNGTLSIVTYYTGSSAPSSSLGEDGDIYLMG